MGEPEIILNLWYVFDDTGMIYSLRARAYVQSGSDEEKLSFLQRFAEIDYLIARPFPIPERFHTTIMEGRARKKMPVISMHALETQGGSVTPGDLFDESMKVIEKDLPAQTTLSIPEDPLICIIGLYADNDGNIRPQIHGRVSSMTPSSEKSQQNPKGYPPLLPEDDRIRQRLKEDRILAKQAVKLWSESVDDQRKMQGPSETELIAVVKANFSTRLRYI
jgi:hypothetical protein